jgi:hypothetical protein
VLRTRTMRSMESLEVHESWEGPRRGVCAMVGGVCEECEYDSLTVMRHRNAGMSIYIHIASIQFIKS